jgi:hypothetical protein
LFSPATGANTFITSVDQISNYTAAFGEAARKGIEQWANDTFAGRADANGKIITYAKRAVYINSTNFCQ